MPDLSIYGTPETEDQGGFERAVSFPRFDEKQAKRAAFDAAQITPYVGDLISAHSSPNAGDVLEADELNDTYGVEGYLSFGKRETRASADYKSRVASRRRWQDQVLSSTPLTGGEAIWQSIKGGIADPVAIPTYFIGIGEVNAGRLGVQGVASVGRSRLLSSGAMRGALDNLAGGAVYESANYGLKTAADEDYDFGAAFDNLTFGTALGAGFGAVGDHIARGARKNGVDPATMRRIAQIESTMNPAAKNPKSSAGGLFQFTDRTWNGMGGGDRYDPALASDRAGQLAASNNRILRRALGREPEGWETYLAHQQGAGGARELLKDPNRSAVSALRAAGVEMAEDAVRLNGGDVSMTAGEFAGIWRAKFNKGGAGGGEAIQITGDLPEPLTLLSNSERAGAWDMAVDQMLDDRPVDVSALMPSGERAFGRRPELSGGDIGLSIPGRAYQADVAVTIKGSELPVRYAVVDLEDLITSHDDNLNLRADYPQEFQERDRGRSGAIAENRDLESRMNPKLLVRDVAAQGGAPIIGPDGVVQSGNGRAIALRRNARASGELYQRYRAELESEGYDLTGIKTPVLVRVNASDMSHGEVLRFTREANQDTVSRKGAVEQAKVDAEKLTPDMLSLLDGADYASAGNREFVRSYVKNVAPENLNQLVTKDGGLSAEAVRRIEASVMIQAYDNPRLVERLFEDPDPNIKSIGRALKASAAGWARLKALIDAGRISPEVDVSADLNSALNLVMQARDSGVPLRELVAERIDQVDMLTGDAMSEAQIVFLRAMFKDTDYRVSRSVDDMVRAMDAYTRQASEITGLDLLGNSALNQAREAFEASYRSIDQNLILGDQRVFTFRPADQQRTVTVSEALGLSGDAGGGERSVTERGDPGAENGGAANRPDGDLKRSDAPKISAQSLIVADPELTALQDDTLALEAEIGLSPNHSPDTVAEAMRAVAFCLIEGGANV